MENVEGYEHGHALGYDGEGCGVNYNVVMIC